MSEDVKRPVQDELESSVWLLVGIGNAVGTLKLTADRLTYTITDTGTLWSSQLKALEKTLDKPGLADDLDRGQPVEILNVSAEGIQSVNFPWYSLNIGLNLVVNNSKFKFSFARPNASLGDVFAQRDTGKTWKIALEKFRRSEIR